LANVLVVRKEEGGKDVVWVKKEQANEDNRRTP
jgi:hypothetical protein